MLAHPPSSSLPVTLEEDAGTCNKISRVQGRELGAEFSCTISFSCLYLLKGTFRYVHSSQSVQLGRVVLLRFWEARQGEEVGVGRWIVILLSAV